HVCACCCAPAYLRRGHWQGVTKLHGCGDEPAGVARVACRCGQRAMGSGRRRGRLADRAEKLVASFKAADQAGFSYSRPTNSSMKERCPGKIFLRAVASVK